MDEELYLIFDKILESHKEIASCHRESDFLNLIYKKPPFYYQQKEIIVRVFIDKLVEKYGGVDNDAEQCGVSVETIKKTRNGTRFPSKNFWVKIGLSLKITPKYVDLFMMAAGYSLNTIYLEDVFFYYGIINGLSCSVVCYLLKSFVNEETANAFLSP